MTSGRVRDILDGIPPGLKWPVACWKSPSVHSDGTTELDIPGPIPAHAFVDYAMENLVADNGYVRADHARLQRPRIVGTSDFIHPIWDDRRKMVVLAAANASNAYCLGNKSTGAATALTAASWNQRVYGAWPLLRDGAPMRRMDRKYGPNFKRAPGIKVLRKRWSSPWIRGASFPLAQSFDLKNWGHNDEPSFIQLWARCADQNAGFGTQDELMLIGYDGGGAGAGGEVWYNGSTVGFVIASGGFPILSNDGATQTVLDPTKWVFQLRCAFAAEPDDLPDGRAPRGNGIVAMWYSRWSLVATGARLTFMMPENFFPIDIGVSLRCRSSAAAAGGWLQNDQCFSRNSGQVNLTFVPQVLLRGRQAIVQFGTASVSLTDKTGPVGTAWSPNDFELQLRMIG